jgi:hypothetical protein
VTANFDNNTTQNVTASALYATSNSTAGLFSTTTKGLFNAAAVSVDTQATLQFTYTHNGVTRQATVDLTVVAPVVTGNALPRYGVAQFSDTDFTGGKTGKDPYNNPYTRWAGLQDFADKVLTNLMPSSNSNETFTVNIGEGQYAYYMHPKSLITDRTEFTDLAINVPGGMGGITWTPEGEVGDSFDPMEVLFDAKDGQGAQPWLIYRTDWDSLGTITFRVRYI